MHSEHIENLHPGWVVGGWLVAVALTSGAFLVLVGLGILGSDTAGTDFLLPLVVGVGFFGGGLFVGLRWSDAPILHGVAITLVSVVVWFAGELIAARFMEPEFASPGESAGFVLGMILLQLVAAVAGGWTGRRMVRRGATPSLEG